MKPRRLAGLALLIAMTLLSTACGSDKFRTEVFLSPDGSLIADWYTEFGGGAAGWTADFVQLRPRTERFRFKDDVVFHGGGAGPLHVVWKSKTELEISYPTLTTVLRSKSTWNNVSISYREDADLFKNYPDSSHFGGVTSPDAKVYAEWSQNQSLGDDHWWEDCLELLRLNHGLDSRKNDCSFVGITGDNLNRHWDTSSHLHVTYPPGTKVIKADPKWNDVTITYSEDPKLQKY